MATRSRLTPVFLSSEFFFKNGTDKTKTNPTKASVRPTNPGPRADLLGPVFRPDSGQRSCCCRDDVELGSGRSVAGLTDESTRRDVSTPTLLRPEIQNNSVLPGFGVNLSVERHCGQQHN